MRIIGHGIDLVPVERMYRLILDHGDHFLARAFSPQEIADCRAQRREAERFASRFAAKEAVFKALGTGMTNGITLLDVAVESLPSGRPTLIVRARAAEIAAAQGITQWHVSLTDTDAYSMASVIACGPD
ncbi:MAG: holo-ACP synthase [Phycisphaeraceae bacterium]|nr:holo-ACP synthase [Phycisphaeraceae bacterium]